MCFGTILKRGMNGSEIGTLKYSETTPVFEITYSFPNILFIILAVLFRFRRGSNSQIYINYNP